jgi:hypothetical protein
MFIADSVQVEQIPNEQFLMSCLQKNICFTINNKVIKRGRLILYKRFHYFIQISLLTEKGAREHLEIPLPFNTELHVDEGLLYLDYRLKALNVETYPKIPDRVPSIFFNKILEMQVITNASLSCV